MRNHSKRKRPTIFSRAIIFPLVTLIVAAVFLAISSFYEPRWMFNWKGIRQEVKDTIKSIDAYGAIPGFHVGYSGDTPKQWHQWQWLMKNTTEEEFLLLLDYPSSTIKALSYRGLLLKTDVNQFDLINKALADTNNFVWQTTGCEGYPLLLGEYLVEQVVCISDLIPPSPNVFKNNKLTKEEIAKLQKVYSLRKAKKEKYLKDYSELLHKRGW